MSTRSAGAGAPLLLVDDEPGYWARYVGSLAGPAGATALTAHPELTRAVLDQVGIAVAVGAGQPAPGPRPPRDPAAALAALRRDGDLGRVSGLERQLRALAGRPAAGAAWIVGVGAAAALGLARAVADGRPFLAADGLADPALADLAARADSLYVVTEQADSGEMARLRWAVDAQARREILPGVRGCPIGYLHGRDFPAMTLLDAKQRCPVPPGAAAGPDLIVDSTVSAAPAPPAPDLVSGAYRELGRDLLAGPDHIRLLAITSHGMSDQIHLNNDYLCGRSPYLAVGPAPTERVPSCTMPDGAFCFFKPAGRALPVHRVPADHVFVNSCGSLGFSDTDFGPLFAIWYAALDGRARSFVGSTRWKDGHGLEALLYRHLVLGGFPLGDAVRLLDRVLPGHQIEGGDVYVLLGDPAERLAPPRPAAGVARLRRGQNRVRVDAGWARLLVTDPDLVAAARETGLRAEVRDDADWHASTVPADDGARVHLLLYSGQPASRELVVDVGDFRADYARALEVCRALDETLDPVLGMAGLYPDRVRQGGRKNLESRLLQISRLYKARFTDPAAARRVSRSCRTLLSELDRADAEIATWLQDRIRGTSYRFSEHYQDNFLLAGAGPDGDCYQCGRPLTRRELRHVLRREVRRIELICARCGSIEDSPDPELSVQVHMGETADSGEKVPVLVRLGNRSDRERAGHCLTAVRKSAGFGVDVPDAVRPVTLPPGGAAELEFTVVLAEALPTHQYDLQAGFVSMTRIVLGRRSFWVSARPAR